MPARKAVARKRQHDTRPRVKVEDDTRDPEWVLSRCWPILKGLPDTFTKPQRVTVTLPDTQRGSRDSIEITICEGELTREYIHLSGEVKGGLNENDDVAFYGGCIRVAQLDRFISILQLARAEAGKRGLLTPRVVPKVNLA